MMKLGSVLNQLVSDVVQAKHHANGLSKEILAEYQKDPVLRFIPAPGLSLKELSLNLKFAFVNKDVLKVSDILAKGFVEEEIRPSIQEAFVNSLTDRTLLETLKKNLKDAFESVKYPDDFYLTEAMKGDQEKSIQSFIKLSQDVYTLLPSETRKKLTPVPDIMRLIEEKSRKDLPLFLTKLRLKLPPVSTGELELTLDKEELQSLPTPLVQELKIVLGSDDIQLLDSTSKSNLEVSDHG